jgi:hypothetical protein
VRAWGKKAESKNAVYHCLLLTQEIIFMGQWYRAAEYTLTFCPWSLYPDTLILWAYGDMWGDNHSREDSIKSCYGAVSEWGERSENVQSNRPSWHPFWRSRNSLTGAE